MLGCRNCEEPHTRARHGAATHVGFRQVRVLAEAELFGEPVHGFVLIATATVLQAAREMPTMSGLRRGWMGWHDKEENFCLPTRLLFRSGVGYQLSCRAGDREQFIESLVTFVDSVLHPARKCHITGFN